MNVEWNKHSQALQVNAVALKVATKIVTSQVCRGFVCVDTKVRCNGRLLEWYMDNGDMVEIYHPIGYESGVPSGRTTSVRHYRYTNNGEGFDIMFEQIFNNNNNLTETK